MRPGSAIILFTALAATLWLAGCQAPAPSYGPSVSSTPAAAEAAHPGGSWELVIPGGVTGPRLAAGPESQRLDSALAHQPASIIDASYWPEPRTDRLHRLRRVFLTGRPGEVLYFRTPPTLERHAYPYRWGW